MRRRTKSKDLPGAAFCEHANENPAVCPCDPKCYCKSHTCAPENKVDWSVIESTFHKLWGNATNGEYDKALWGKFQNLLTQARKESGR